MVRMTPMGVVFETFFLPSQKSQMSISGVCLAVGDGLGRVNDAAAADGEYQLRVHGDGFFDAFARKAQVRVRLHAAKLLMGNACAVQQRKDLIQKPAFLRALSAVDHQHA